MLSIRKILAPVDFSEPSEQAARYAASMARFFDADLTLLHVAPPLRYEFAMTEPAGDRYQEMQAGRRADVERALGQIAARLNNGTKVSCEALEGDAAEEIIRRAHNGGFGAIVMSTRGAGPLRRWLLVGSVTSKVLYGAGCPVISCSCFTNADPPREVVCAVDLGPQSERALRYADGIARLFEARLSIVHVAPAMGEGAHDFFDESWRATLISRLREKLASMASSMKIEADIVVETGNPPRTIAAAARRIDAGLMVLGRGASTDLLGRLSASGYDIVRESPCPVLTV
jgi:nucleotide-binding universal stress UspA family protein